MIKLDDDLLQEYLAESGEHLSALEASLLAMENGGAENHADLVNRAVQAIRSVKGGAAFFELIKIRELADRIENALALIRARKVIATPVRLRTLLGANDKLHTLLENPGASEMVDTGESMAALAQVCADGGEPIGGGRADGGRLRMLLVEDDFTSRLMLQAFLSRYGDCHVAVNGKEAVEAVGAALERGQRYDLICMDIMMPEMDGREAVRRIRVMEEAYGTLSTAGAKIIMTTAVEDVKEVVRCFRELCDAYLMKPIDLAQLLHHMKSYQLVP